MGSNGRRKFEHYLMRKERRKHNSNLLIRNYYRELSPGMAHDNSVKEDLFVVNSGE